MKTDTSEKGLERLICLALTGTPCDPGSAKAYSEPVAPYAGSGWLPGDPADLAALTGYIRRRRR